LGLHVYNQNGDIAQLLSNSLAKLLPTDFWLDETKNDFFSPFKAKIRADKGKNFLPKLIL